MKQTKTVLHHYLGTELEMINNLGDRIFLNELAFIIPYAFLISEKPLKWKPALHSINRLTMPLENGEIPILELAKIAFPDWEFELNKSGAIARKHFSRIFFYWCDTYFSAFDETAKSIDVPNQIRLIDYFHKKHFNLYGLSESEYIEKSTLKI